MQGGVYLVDLRHALQKFPKERPQANVDLRRTRRGDTVTVQKLLLNKVPLVSHMQSVRISGAAVPSSGSSDTSTRTHLVDDILEEDWERQCGVLQLVQTAVNQSFILKKKQKSQFEVTKEAEELRTSYCNTVFSAGIFLEALAHGFPSQRRDSNSPDRGRGRTLACCGSSAAAPASWSAVLPSAAGRV